MGWERESGDRQLEWGGKGRVVIDRRRSGVWEGRVVTDSWSGVGRGEWG